KDGVNATPLPTVNTTGYIDHAAFLGTINPDTNKIPKHLFQGYLNIHLLTLWVCKLLMLICILTKNVITSCSVTMMLFLHLEVKPLMTLTTVLYLSCALISGHLAMMLMELTKRR